MFCQDINSDVMAKLFSREGMNRGLNLVVEEPKKIIDGLGVLEKREYVEKKELIERTKLDDAYIEKMLKMGLIDGKSEEDKTFYRMSPAGASFYSLVLRKRFL